MTAQHITTQVPVLLGDGYEHIMATADVVMNDVYVVVNIQITETGEKANDLVALFTSGEPQGLKFVAIPVTPPSLEKEHDDK